MISPAGVAAACASRAGEAGRYSCTVFLPSTRPAPRNPPRAPPARPCSPRSAGQGKRWRSSQRPGGTDGETPWLAPTHHDSPTRRLVLALPHAPGQAVGERIRPAVTWAGASSSSVPPRPAAAQSARSSAARSIHARAHTKQFRTEIIRTNHEKKRRAYLWCRCICSCHSGTLWPPSRSSCCCCCSPRRLPLRLRGVDDADDVLGPCV